MKALRLIDHPNIAIASFEDVENSYLVMEYADGGNLNGLLQNGPVDKAAGVMFLRQLLLVLNEIHSKKIVHKDIKPDNILTTQVRGMDLIKHHFNDCGITIDSKCRSKWYPHRSMHVNSVPHEAPSGERK